VRIGVISDIHGNLEALEAVVAVLRDKGATQFVCCGDIVGYGSDPNLCVEAIRRMRCTCVAGNHDYGAIGKVPIDGFNSVAAQALLWTRGRLTESNRLFLEKLPLTAEEGPLFVVHSSPSAPAAWEYVLNLRAADREMEHYAGGVCMVGHSHQPFAAERQPGRPARIVRGDTFKVLAKARYFINAGSVGQPRDCDPRACCLMYDEAVQEVTYLRVAYDIAAVQAKIRAAGLAEYLASRLESGR